MKKVFLILTSIALIYTSSYAGTTPDVVKKSFVKKFPTVTKVSWGKESATEWEAEFSLNGKKVSANFAQDGAWLETENKIAIASLPKPVAAAIKSRYAEWTITEADMTETAKNGTVYEADLKMGKMKKGVAYKADGTPVVE